MSLLRAAALFFALIASSLAHAEPRHGLSTFGDLKYPPNFKHFDYVDPNAPKGGALSQVGIVAVNTFDSLNPFILKGDSPEGLLLNSHDGVSLVFDTLMTASGDEPDALYGLVARTIDVDADKTRAVFSLRPEARWQDGTPLTAADVVFTIEMMKTKAHPNIRMPLRDVSSAKALDAQTVEVRLTGDNRRDLPLVVASLPIISKAYYTKHNFEETSLDRPLGSGPYKVGAFKAGSYIVYDRVKDYWAKDLPVNRGRWNFDSIRIEFYRDRAVGFQAFGGATYDLREEFTSKTWATEYDFPAVRDGRVQRLSTPDNTPTGVQGFFLNTRRAHLKDARVRKALDIAFDYEWLNKNLFYGLYDRMVSYFQNSGMEARGAPSSAELRLLEPFRDRLPAEVFKPVYKPPVTDGSGNNRAQLREARALFEAAGYRYANGKLTGADGKVLALEFVSDDPRQTELCQPYVGTLRALGIDATIRPVDPAQFERRKKNFDFDLIPLRFSQSLTPGIELRSLFSSAAAKADGTYNLSGIADPVVDSLIEKVIAARSREELAVAVSALDRVLIAGHYWISNWYKSVHQIAYWDKFGRPKTMPKYQRGILDTWWYDKAKAEKITNRSAR